MRTIGVPDKLRSKVKNFVGKIFIIDQRQILIFFYNVTRNKVFIEIYIQIWPLLAGIALRKNNKDNESYYQLLKDCEGKQTIWVDEIERVSKNFLENSLKIQYKGLVQNFSERRKISK